MKKIVPAVCRFRAPFLYTVTDDDDDDVDETKYTLKTKLFLFLTKKVYPFLWQTLQKPFCF